jgi:hypothetical protein
MGLAVGAMVLSPLAPALAQTSQEVADMLRKAKNNEPEGGFCATVSWPQRNTLNAFYGFLDGFRPGSTYFARSRYSETSAGCSYYRIVSAHLKGEASCVMTESWACSDGKECFEVKREWCKRNNNWTFTRD